MIDLGTKHEELRQRALLIQAEVEAFRKTLAAEVGNREKYFIKPWRVVVRSRKFY